MGDRYIYNVLKKQKKKFLWGLTKNLDFAALGF